MRGRGDYAHFVAAFGEPLRHLTGIFSSAGEFGIKIDRIDQNPHDQNLTAVIKRQSPRPARFFSHSTGNMKRRTATTSGAKSIGLRNSRVGCPSLEKSRAIIDEATHAAGVIWLISIAVNPVCSNRFVMLCDEKCEM